MNLVDQATHCPDDQATRLRALFRGHESACDAPAATSPSSLGAASPSPLADDAHRATTIAIASGKGGVGKTTIAVNLALALADAGTQTVLLDGDLGLANADLLLGVSAARHLGHALDGRASAADLLTPVTPRLHLVAGGSGLAHLADLDAERRHRLLNVVGEIELRARAVVIDCGAGIGAGVLDLLGAADEALVVTSPEPTALADAYGLIKSLTRRMHPGMGASISLIVNEAADAREALGVHVRAAAVCHRFLMLPLPLAGWVPADPLVSRAVRARTPLVRYAARSPASAAVKQLAQRLRDELGLIPQGQAVRGGGGLVARLLRGFRSTSAAAMNPGK